MTRNTICWAFFFAWLGALIVQRLRSWGAYRRGVLVHSRYAGQPLLRIPFVRSEEEIMGFWEPAVAFFGGILLCSLSIDLGGFVACSGFALLIRNGIEREIERKRLQRMQDAMIEHAYYADRFRERR